MQVLEGVGSGSGSSLDTQISTIIAIRVFFYQGADLVNLNLDRQTFFICFVFFKECIFPFLYIAIMC